MTTERAATGQTIYIGLRYADARRAIAWLQEAFGAEPHAVYDGDDGSIMHAELAVAGNVVMLGNVREDDNPVRPPGELQRVTAGIYVALADAPAVDALHARAAAAGAKIVKPPNDTDYGSHDFSVLDVEGNPWTFGTYRPQLAT
jgi:uncharacterized glyoxalase superfamily protein PhnB